MIAPGTIVEAPWGTYVFRGLVMPDGKLSLQDGESPSRFVCVAEARIGTGDGFDYQIRWQGQAAIGGAGHGLEALGTVTARSNVSSAASHGNAALGEARDGMESLGKATTNDLLMGSDGHGMDAPGVASLGSETKCSDGNGCEGRGEDTDDSRGSATRGSEAPGRDAHGEERQGLPTHSPDRPEQCAWMKEVLKQTIKCGAWECPPSCPNNAGTTLWGVLWRVPPPMEPDERRRVDAAFAHLRALRAKPRPEATSVPQPAIVWRAKHVGKPPWSHDPKGAIWDRPGLGEKRKAQLIEWYEERAGIMEHMGKLSTGEAEYRAYGLLVENCRRHGVAQ